MQLNKSVHISLKVGTLCLNITRKHEYSRLLAIFLKCVVFV